jgi:hypothetical protein
MKSAYRDLLKQLEGKKPFGRPGCTWEDNIRMDLKEIGRKDVNSIRNWKERCKLHAAGSGYGRLGFSEHDVELLGIIRAGKFLDKQF